MKTVTRTIDQGYRIQGRQILLVLTAMAWIACGGLEQDSPQDASLYQHLGGDFELIDHEGRPFRLSAYEGVGLLFFGFTSCPDVCPVTMSRLAKVMAQLPAGHDVSVLFVSVDPRRDTPARLREYGASYDFPWIGLTTDDPQQIPIVARSFAAGVGRGEDGAIDHSSRIYLLDRDHSIRSVFSGDDEIDHMVDAIRSTLD